MKTYIIRDIPIKLEKEELYRFLKMPPDLEEEDAGTIWRMAGKCLETANPKAVYGVAAIEEKGKDYVVADGQRIDSPLVARNLERVSRIIPFVATCGIEAEEWSRQYAEPLEAYWADGIKLLLLARVRAALTAEVRERYFPSGDLSAMSPGSLEAWPLPQQRALFSLIGGVREAIGVELTESCLMLPSKSGSGFFFSAQSHYENCTFCPIISCPDRRAEYRGR